MVWSSYYQVWLLLKIREFVSKNLSNFSPQNVLDISSSLPLLDLFGLDNRLNISRLIAPNIVFPPLVFPLFI